MSFRTDAARRRRAMANRPSRRRPPKIASPESLRREYERDLLKLVARVEKRIEETLIQALPRLVREDGTRLDQDWPREIERLIDALEAWVEANVPDQEQRTERLAQLVARFNRAQILSQVKSVTGVEILIREPDLPALIAQFARENAQLIRSIPSELLDQVAEIAKRELRDGQGALKITKEIRERFGVARSRAQLIARDQVGKLNGQLTASRHQTLGVVEFIWRTSGDARVRDEHEVLDGQVFRYDSPPAIGLPGEDYQCRCWAEPVLDHLIQELRA